MYHTITLLLHEELGMASLCVGENIYLRNSTSEITIKNYLILIYASITEASANSMIRLRNKSMYLLLKHEGDSELKGDSLRTFKLIQGLIYHKQINIDLLSGNRVSRAEKKLDIVISKGLFVSKQYDKMIDLDNELGIEYNPNHEKRESIHHLRKDPASREVHLEGKGCNKNDKRNCQGSRSDTQNSLGCESEESKNQLLTFSLKDKYLHFKAGTTISYVLSANGETPFFSRGKRNRVIPEKNILRAIDNANNGKLSEDRKYKESYIK